MFKFLYNGRCTLLEILTPTSSIIENEKWLLLLEWGRNFRKLLFIIREMLRVDTFTDGEQIKNEEVCAE